MDVETMKIAGGVQIPMGISFSYKVRNKVYAFVTLINV